MEQQITAMWAQVVATACVGLVKCGLIAWGLRLLSRSGGCLYCEVLERFCRTGLFMLGPAKRD